MSLISLTQKQKQSPSILIHSIRGTRLGLSSTKSREQHSLTEGFKFLVVTDIAAYFENIQLPILRDVLLRIFPQDQKIVNFLISVLEYWCPHTNQHRTFHRGIPQGTQISSFLGNLFLMPLDAVMESFCAEHPAKYFRSWTMYVCSPENMP
jgi:hypothetical protein